VKFILVLSILFIALESSAVRLKDIANIRGVRENQLVGYGVVVGLAGTGDNKSEFTEKSFTRMLDKLGMKLGKETVSQNVAAVIITATLPAFARAGNTIDITVNAVGDASSLRGGTLIQTPLRAANQEIFAVAQGPIIIGDAGGASHNTVGKIPNGAIIERDVSIDFTTRKMFRMTLNNPDFTTAARVSKVINQDLSGKYAVAKDASTIDIIVPQRFEGKTVDMLATIEGLEVTPDHKAKVILNQRTGTVVIGSGVRISEVAISHGDLTVKVGGAGATVRGPASAGGGKKDDADKVGILNGDASVGGLVKALNGLGVSPKDLISIIQDIKAVGALQGDLEIL
jgi:flagellar P-ring protein FlgI